MQTTGNEAVRDEMERHLSNRPTVSAGNGNTSRYSDFMKFKTSAWICLLTMAVAAMLAVAIHYLATKDPTPIRMDARIYDDYAGYYVFSNGYPLTIRRDGSHLMSTVPEHAAKELFPETETRFFMKGRPMRRTFHRDEKGRVDYAVSRGKNFEEWAEKRAALPRNPEGTNGLIAARTGGEPAKA